MEEKQNDLTFYSLMMTEISMRIKNIVIYIREIWENIMRYGKSGVQSAWLHLIYPNYVSLTTRMVVICSLLIIVQEFILKYLVILQCLWMISLTWSHLNLLLLVLLPSTLPYSENTMWTYLSISPHIMIISWNSIQNLTKTDFHPLPASSSFLISQKMMF